jgi:hypothetical protein
MTDTEASPKILQPDTSDFVEHLRLVHFTWIAASMITLIAITSQETSSAARAYTQTNDLLKASSRWHFGLWATSLITQRRQTVFQSKNIVERQKVSLEVVTPTRTQEVEFSADLKGSWRLADIGSQGDGKSIGKDLRIPDNDDNAKRELSPNFNNLDGAMKIWDRLNRFQYIVFVNDLKAGWYVQLYGSHQPVSIAPSQNPTSSLGDSRTEITLGNPGLLLRQDLLDTLKRGPWLYGDARLAVSGQTSDPYVDAYNTLLKLVSDDKQADCYYFDRDHMIVLRAECVVDYFPLQLALTDGLIPATPLGNFARSFPDVEELAKHLSELSLSDLQTFFLAEKNRVGDKVEFPGVKVPGEAITSWGLIIIVALLAYFGIMLREFSLRVTPDDNAWKVPWIGASRDILSRTAFLASLVFALSTVGYLAANCALKDSSVLTRAGYTLAAASGVVVIALILFVWQRVLQVRTPIRPPSAT